MSGWLNGAFEEKIVYDIRSCTNKLHKSFRKHQIRTFLQKVLCPFHKHSSHSTSIERSCSIFVDLSYLWTRKNIVGEDQFHILFESLLFFNGFLEQKVDVFIYCLIIHILGISKGKTRKMIE